MRQSRTAENPAPAKHTPTRYGFVITKPLQLMVVLSLVEQLDRQISKDFLLVDNFAGAESLHRQMLSRLDPGCRVFYFAEERQAYAFAVRTGYDKLLIDSDVGFRRNLTIMAMAIRRPSMMLAVYEEGLGSYRLDLYPSAKRRALASVGCGVYFGGNWRTREIYLFQPEKCVTPISARKIKLEKSISQLLAEKWGFLSEIFSAREYMENFTNLSNPGDCIIYLTGWTVDEVRLATLARDGASVIVKPHPHIKNIDSAKWGGCLSMAPANVPAEIIISAAATSFRTVRVLHHGSSVGRYLQIDNVSFERVS